MDHGTSLGSPRTRPGRTRLSAGLSLFAILSIGLVWLVYGVIGGMRSGRDSDLHRRWVVSQYVRVGINPYPLASAALEHNFGPLGGGRAKPRVYAIPRLAAADPAVDAVSRPLLAAYRTPEAVYPPSADWLLSLTLGRLSEGQVHLAGMVANSVLLFVCVALLARLPGGTPRSPLAYATAAAVVLIWSPTQSTVYAGQFSLLVTVCLLLAFQRLDRNEYQAGVWLGLALIKPSMALPFLILPLVRGRWRALAVAGGLHLAATGVQAVRFGTTPWDLLRQWAGVAAYFTQGQFTLQEVLSALRLADTPAGLAVVAAFLLFATGWCLANRRAGDDLLIDLLCVVSILWTYHGPYDFVILLVPLARRLVPTPDVRTDRVGSWFDKRLAAGLLICVSMAASPPIYGDEVHVWSRLIRHGARLSLLLGFVAVAVDVWKAARIPRAVEPLDQNRVRSTYSQRLGPPVANGAYSTLIAQQTVGSPIF